MMTKSVFDLSTRELLSIATLLNEARDLVAEEAKARALRLVVVAVDDTVLVNRARVVLVVTTLLRNAISAAPVGGRVAVTAQEIERELVFAVYDSGLSSARSSAFDDFASETACMLGGRIWSAGDNLSLFSVPLYGEEN